MIRLPMAMALVVLPVTFAAAQEHAPRVVSEHNADVYSLETFAEFPRWRELEGDKRAWEIYRYLADTRTGVFPLGNEIREGNETLPEFSLVRDPVKLLNVYGYGFCGILGPAMAGILEGTGVGKARTLDIPGIAHVAAETFYGGAWHYFDLDLRAAFRRTDGSFASMADAKRDASLWTGQGPLFFPADSLGATREAYETTAVHHLNDVPSGGHTMDYVLRQGETFTRWWKPQGGRWQHLDAYHQAPFHRQLLEQQPRGPKSKHAGWTIFSHGNGRFVYSPNLTDASSDFEHGSYDAVNVRPGATGLTLGLSGEGHAIFEVRSPYVIVPLIGKMETRADDREASVVAIDAMNAALSISLDGGLTWKPVAVEQGAVDLTPHVSGTYGYLLKIALKGDPGAAVVRSLAMTTWVQVAPASLPSLRRGRNRMEYRTGDHYGLQSRVLEISTAGSSRADFLKYLHEPPADFDPARATGRATGAFIVKVPSPPNSRIAWLSAGGSFATYQLEAARQTGNRIAYAVDEPRDFKTIYQAAVPTDQEHWHYNADREVKLDAPARTVYLQYVGNPAVNSLRIYAHYVNDRPRSSAPVTITHLWTEGGLIRSRSVVMASPGPYEVMTSAEPVDEAIEMAVASVTTR